jgi:hypothetical protein
VSVVMMHRNAAAGSQQPSGTMILAPVNEVRLPLGRMAGPPLDRPLCRPPWWWCILANTVHAPASYMETHSITEIHEKQLVTQLIKKFPTVRP